MIRPTQLFKPFGEEGPKVVLFGKKTGNWNMSRLQKKGDHLSDPGLYYRLSFLSEVYRFSKIAVPIPSDCNTEVHSLIDFPVSIQNGAGSLTVMRGLRADGIILQKGLTGAIASADCPTIIAYCPVGKTTIVAHGGSKSLIHINHILNPNITPREPRSVVDQVVSKTQFCGFCQVKIFITCGISGQNYSYPELVPFVKNTFGDNCVANDGIDLKKIIAMQFAKYNITDVMVDCIDTYDDVDGVGDFVWHSYRRGWSKSEEKRGRNLVLVVNS